MIYLIRHGQTDWNLFKRANGITDVYLNKTGIQQANRLADELKDINFDVCFCSTLTRARQFCEIIYNSNIPIYDERLIEIDCGQFEGMEETPEIMKLMFQAFQTGEKGTERFDSFINRNIELCDLITNDYNGKNVMVITHAANARVFHYYFNGKPIEYDWTKPVSTSGGLIMFNN